MDATERLIEQKHILIRRLENDTFQDKLTIENEIARLDNIIYEKLQEKLKVENEKIKGQIQVIQKTIFDDGRFKREIAKVLINFLRTELDDKEVKGVMRQGYRQMRGL